MKKFFRQLSLKQFRIIIALLVLSGDAMFIAYMYQNVSERSFIEQELSRGLASQGISYNDITPQDKEQAYQTIISFVKMSFALFLVVHALLALLFYLGKQATWKYFKYYSLLAVLFLPLLLVLNFHVILLAVTPTYLVVALGLFYRPWEKVEVMAS